MRRDACYTAVEMEGAMLWLRERKPKEIEAEDLARAEQAASLNMPYIKGNVCPIVAQRATGKGVDAWDLTEKEVLEEIEGIMGKMGRGESLYLSMEAVRLWGEKHPVVSAKFIERVFWLLDHYPKGQENDLLCELTRFIEPQLDQARAIAKYVKGKRGNFSPVTLDEILKVIINIEKMEQARTNEQEAGI